MRNAKEKMNFDLIAPFLVLTILTLWVQWGHGEPLGGARKAKEPSSAVLGVNVHVLDSLRQLKESIEVVPRGQRPLVMLDLKAFKINVGGTVFMTTKSTILTPIQRPKNKRNEFNSNSSSGDYYPAHRLELLTKRLSHERSNRLATKKKENISCACNEDGENELTTLFVDRNPKYFPLVLDYLRLATVGQLEQINLDKFNGPPFDWLFLENVREEATYFNLVGLRELVDERIANPLANSEMVKLNVGGSLFAMFRETLTKKIKKFIRNETVEAEYYEPHLLELFVSGQASAKIDRDGAIFIDRNPTHFQAVLDFLRLPQSNSRRAEDFVIRYSDDLILKAAILKEAEFYRLDALRDSIFFWEAPLTWGLTSQILRKNKQESNFFELMHANNKLQNKTLRLLYRASEDGFAASDFHRKCDGKANTITIVKSRDTAHIFGGYTAQTWDSSSWYKQDPAAFLFSLVNSQNKPFVINAIPDSPHSIACSSSYGPTFGGGHDLYICSNANTVKESYSNFPYSYESSQYSSKTDESKSLLAGSHKFFVSEMEVFQHD